MKNRSFFKKKRKTDLFLAKRVKISRLRTRNEKSIAPGLISNRSDSDGVGYAYSEVRIKPNYLPGRHRTKFSKILSLQQVGPFPHAA